MLSWSSIRLNIDSLKLLNMRLGWNTEGQESCLIYLLHSSGQPRKNDISTSLEFSDGVAPDHHGNCSFRHGSPGVLCNACPNSLWLHMCLTSRCTSTLNLCNIHYTFAMTEIAAATACAPGAVLMRRFSFCFLTVSVCLFAVAIIDT